MPACSERSLTESAGAPLGLRGPLAHHQPPRVRFPPRLRAADVVRQKLRTVRTASPALLRAMDPDPYKQPVALVDGGRRNDRALNRIPPRHPGPPEKTD